MTDSQTHSPRGAGLRPRSFWLFARLASQNLGRRPARTFLLVVSVALGSSAVFASFIAARGIHASMEVSFSRMGADVLVVPKDTLVNITSALLTVQPTEHTLDRSVVEEVARVPGVARVAPQRIFRVAAHGASHGEVNLVAFDPALDFSVLPWVKEKLDRPMRAGDVLAGARTSEKLGSEIQLCGRPLTVYARLDRTGVGPFEESLFTTFDTVAAMGRDPQMNGPAASACLADSGDGKVSALLLRLAVGTTPEQVGFAVSRLADVKAIAGGSIMTSSRQSLIALLAGTAAFTALLFAALLIMVGVMFSAIIAERRREVGVLMAVGARRGQVIRMLIAEAGFTTGLGGFSGMTLGVTLLIVFQRTLGFYVETLRIPFLWPSARTIAWSAAVCVTASYAIGVAGAFIPAWRACREEPYALIQAEPT